MKWESWWEPHRLDRSVRSPIKRARKRWLKHGASKRLDVYSCTYGKRGAIMNLHSSIAIEHAKWYSSAAPPVIMICQPNMWSFNTFSKQGTSFLHPQGTSFRHPQGKILLGKHQTFFKNIYCLYCTPHFLPFWVFHKGQLRAQEWQRALARTNYCTVLNWHVALREN